MKNTKILLGLLVVVIAGFGYLFVSSKATLKSKLYPSRINLVEKLNGMTKIGEVAKAKYALSLAEIRLNELQSLKDKNNLESEGSLARDNFNQQTILVQNAIINLTGKEGTDTKDILQLSEDLDVIIERAKAIYNIDQLEVLPEGAPIPKATSTPSK
jgi:hypothetical protein